MNDVQISRWQIIGQICDYFVIVLDMPRERGVELRRVNG